MILKPPPPEAGASALDAFREAVKLYEGTLTNRIFRELHRKELARWQKLYATLAGKRAAGSAAALHFTRLSALCGELLAEYGPEVPPKRRQPKASTAVVLSYPDFSDEITHRLHFLEGSSLRRHQAVHLAAHARVVSRQTSGRGRVLVSVGVAKEDVRFFERLVEAIGDLATGDFERAGFDIGYVMRPEGIPQGQPWTPAPLDPMLPIARIRSDNERARGYSWQARALGEQWRGFDGTGLPDDLPDLENSPPWDPDPVWQHVLDLTEANRLQEAIEMIDAIPGRDREALFDEVIYLRFLTKSRLQAEDIRLLARKYAESSLIAGRLMEEFEAFVEHLDRKFELDAPQILKSLRDLGRTSDHR